MDLITVFLVAIALGTDALSMAISIGLGGIRWKHVFLISGIIAVFHVFMPLIGLYLGSLLGSIIGTYAAIIGAIVLIFIGVQMLRESFKKEEIRQDREISTGIGSLVIIACSVSMDALSVGFGLGVVEVNLALTVAIMGVVAGLMTALGFVVGKKLGPVFGSRAQLIGGLILIGIGIKMFW